MSYLDKICSLKLFKFKKIKIIILIINKTEYLIFLFL